MIFELTFKHLTDGSMKIIECKKWVSTKEGIQYIPVDGCDYIDFPYVNTTDLVLWEILNYKESNLNVLENLDCER